MTFVLHLVRSFLRPNAALMMKVQHWVICVNLNTTHDTGGVADFRGGPSELSYFARSSPWSWRWIPGLFFALAVGHPRKLAQVQGATSSLASKDTWTRLGGRKTSVNGGTWGFAISICLLRGGYFESYVLCFQKPYDFFVCFLYCQKQHNWEVLSVIFWSPLKYLQNIKNTTYGYWIF